MDEATRERRVAELRVLQCTNPRDLIQQYCDLMHEFPSSQMPRGVSFSRMIDAIVDHEAQVEKSATATT